jgi:putative transposase
MVFCVKYGRKLLRDADRINYLKSFCSEIGERYWFEFDAIGTDGDHVHIFVGAAPRYSPSAISIAVTVAAFQMQALGRFWGIFPTRNLGLSIHNCRRNKNSGDVCQERSLGLDRCLCRFLNKYY